MMEPKKVLVAVQGDQPVVFEALGILAKRGVETVTLPSLPSQLPAGHVLFTGSNLPTRFPNAHLRLLGQVVYVRMNLDKRKRNPHGFAIAVEEMAIRLGVLGCPPSPKKHRGYLGSRRRTEYSLT